MAREERGREEGGGMAREKKLGEEGGGREGGGGMAREERRGEREEEGEEMVKREGGEEGREGEGVATREGGVAREGEGEGGGLKVGWSVRLRAKFWSVMSRFCFAT